MSKYAVWSHLDLITNITHLESENAKLREALKPLALIEEALENNGLDECRPEWGEPIPDNFELYCGRGGKRLLTVGDARKAKAALTGEKIYTNKWYCPVCGEPECNDIVCPKEVATKASAECDHVHPDGLIPKNSDAGEMPECRKCGKPVNPFEGFFKEESRKDKAE